MEFLTTLTLIKVAFTMVAVLGLSLVAEQISARAAGVLAGFPHGIAIVLYFIGVEQGVQFASLAAQFSIAGLSANVVFAFSYSMLAKRGVLPAIMGALMAFFMVAGILRLIAPNPIGAVLLTLACIGLAWMLLRKAGSSDTVLKPKIKPVEMLFRAIFAALIVVAITSIAAMIGPSWAGLLAGFPVVTFPLLVIIHLRHGAQPIRAIVRHYPFGLLSLLVFTITVSWAFQTLGIGFGTLAGLGAALVYLIGASFIVARV